MGVRGAPKYETDPGRSSLALRRFSGHEPEHPSESLSSSQTLVRSPPSGPYVRATYTEREGVRGPRLENTRPFSLFPRY